MLEWKNSGLFQRKRARKSSKECDVMKITDIYYLNSRGEKLNLLSPPYQLQTANLFDYSWIIQVLQGAEEGR